MSERTLLVDDWDGSTISGFSIHADFRSGGGAGPAKSGGVDFGSTVNLAKYVYAGDDGNLPGPLTATSNAGTVTLAWTAPEHGCDGYLVQRDGATVAQLPNTVAAYTDTPPAGSHSYAVVAVFKPTFTSRPQTAAATV